MDQLADRIGNHAADGVRQRFARALATRERADDSVEAGREYVEAYVEYVHYVAGLHSAIAGLGGHAHEGEETDTHAADEPR